MKGSIFSNLKWLTGLFILAAVNCHADDMELTSDAAVRTNGTYTYFSGQTEGKPSFFTTKFYPDPNTLGSNVPSNKDGNLDASEATPSAIPIASGDLTDQALDGSPRNDTHVTGWIGNTSYTGDSTSAYPGHFDVVFDLAGSYENVTKIIVNYTDAPGHRFDPTPKSQIALYGTNAPDNTEMGGLSAFASSTATADTKTGDMVFAAEKPVRARYLAIRFTMSVCGKGTASTGGYINSVRILQSTSTSNVTKTEKLKWTVFLKSAQAFNFLTISSATHHLIPLLLKEVFLQLQSPL